MSELPPTPEFVDDYLLDGRPLSYWHTYLVTDEQSGEDISGAWTYSRYAQTVADCAWYAVAAEIVYQAESACTADQAHDRTRAGLAFMMSLVVNDHEDISALLRDHPDDIPDCLKPYVELAP